MQRPRPTRCKCQQGGGTRHVPNAGVGLHRLVTACQSDRGRRLGGGGGGWGQGAGAQQAKTMSRCESQIGNLPTSQSSVLACVNHLQTARLHPSGLQYETHYS